jgi:hypothetical protein
MDFEASARALALFSLMAKLCGAVEVRQAHVPATKRNSPVVRKVGIPMNLSAESTTGPTGFEVTVIYNGVPKPIEHVEPQEHVNALLQRALEVFGIRDRPHAYALYRLTGEEIPNNETVHAAGIGPYTKVLLREKIVGGG